MADHFYSITVPGGDQVTGAVVKGTSTASTNVELRVTDGVSGNTKEQLLSAVTAIEAFILTDSAPA